MFNSLEGAEYEDDKLGAPYDDDGTVRMNENFIHQFVRVEHYHHVNINAAYQLNK